MHLQNWQVLQAMATFRMILHAAQIATVTWSSEITLVVIALFTDQSTALTIAQRRK